jgi:hypothetical protein
VDSRRSRSARSLYRTELSRVLDEDRELPDLESGVAEGEGQLRLAEGDVLRGPGYLGCSAGHFDAFHLWANNGWINNGDEHFDYGIAITQNNQFGQKVVNAVGGNGIIYNPGRPSVTSFGYPGNIAGGEQQEACQGSLSRRSITNSDQKLNCTWGNGVSGGPMLQNYDTSFPRLGWIVSVIAYALSDDTATFGPYFDSDTQSLVNAAQNASPT